MEPDDHVEHDRDDEDDRATPDDEVGAVDESPAAGVVDPERADVPEPSEPG